jgi:hypothetical protein
MQGSTGLWAFGAFFSANHLVSVISFYSFLLPFFSKACIESQLSGYSENKLNCHIILLATLGAVLIKRWQTKCADNMEAFCAEIALLIDKLRCESISDSSSNRRV